MVAERKLSFVAYRIVDGSQFDKHSEDLAWLKSVGFITSEFYICPNTDKVIAGASFMKTNRHKMSFLIDGLVIKVNDKTQYKRLGGTSKTPHFCTALKFPPEEKQTKLLSIEHSYGRTGAVTPVAILETIELALTKVSRASLHNWDLAEYLGVHVGCNVIVRKAGEIIPEIVKVVETGRSKDDYEKWLYDNSSTKQHKGFTIHDNSSTFRSTFELAYGVIDWYIRPFTCEHCGATLQNHTNRGGDNLTSWICPNSACTIKQFKQIVKFVGKESLNIMGVGESLIEAMLSKGLIKNAAGLFTVSKDDLLTLDGVKERSAEKAIDAINESRDAYLNNLLAGLGIPNLGKTSSGPIADSFQTLEAVSKATVAQLESIDGIGNELAESIVEWFQNADNMTMTQFFIDNSIASEAKPSIVKSQKLKDLVFIMTGKFDDLGRGEFKDLVAEHGGGLSSGITKKVNYVLMGDGAGPAKSKKINELLSQGVDIKVIGSTEFRKMLED
jgi:DNA ligase (NAD+)